jgi:hypothetical protein
MMLMDNPKIKTPCPCSNTFTSPTGKKLAGFAVAIITNFMAASFAWSLAVHKEYIFSASVMLVSLIFVVLLAQRVVLYNTNRDFIACIKCTVLRFNPFHTKPSGPREDEQLNNGKNDYDGTHAN